MPFRSEEIRKKMQEIGRRHMARMQQARKHPTQIKDCNGEIYDFASRTIAINHIAKILDRTPKHIDITLRRHGSIKGWEIVEEYDDWFSQF